MLPHASSGAASRAKDSAETLVHLIFFDELTPVCLCDAPLNGDTKPLVVFQQSKRGVFDETLRFDTFTVGNLGKLGLLLRGEIHFHAF